MQLIGKLIQMLPLQTGQGKNGQRKKQDIVVETEGQYPKKVCISIWGDKINPALTNPHRFAMIAPGTFVGIG